MNPNQAPSVRTTNRIRGRLTLGLALVAACACFTRAAEEASPAAGDESAPAAPSASPAAKVYQLYVGADIDVPQGEEFFRMHRFTNYSAEIRVDGRARRVRLNEARAMRVARDMKLSVDAVTLTNVKVDRAFTAGRDPFRTWASAGLSSGPATSTAFERNPNIPQPSRGGPSAGTPDLRFEAVELTTHETFGSSGNAMTDSAQFMNRSMVEEGREQFDAVEASFTISASTQLDDCYLVFICDFRPEKDSDAIQRWIHLKTIDDLSPEPRKIHIFDGGLPPGFELIDHEFHIYSGEREVATNLSDKRIELTEDEAFIFMNLQYLGAHRGETLPPVVAWAEVPRDLADRLPPDVLRWPIYVQVDADGRVIGIAADDEGKRGAPKRVVDAIRQFRFNPALDKGKAVPGKVVLRIADFLPPLPE